MLVFSVATLGYGSGGTAPVESTLLAGAGTKNQKDLDTGQCLLNTQEDIEGKARETSDT